MATIIQINGANPEDEKIRHEVFSSLNELSTEELKRLDKLKNNPKCRNFLKTSFQFGLLEVAINKFG